MPSSETLIKELAKNSVTLQKATVKMVESTNKLSKKIDRLLTIFEEASKHVDDVDTDKVRQLTMKLDNLLDQNRDLAKGLLLLEKYVRDREFKTL